MLMVELAFCCRPPMHGDALLLPPRYYADAATPLRCAALMSPCRCCCLAITLLLFSRFDTDTLMPCRCRCRCYDTLRQHAAAIAACRCCYAAKMLIDAA